MNQKIILNLARTTLPTAIPVFTAGCWTPPNANVQPAGEPGLIQSGLRVESVKDSAIVQVIDTGTRRTTFKLSDNTLATYNIGDQVHNFGLVQVSDRVTVTVAEDLAIYNMPANGRLPGGATAETLGVNARVLLVDPQLPVVNPAISQRAVGDIQARPGRQAGVHGPRRFGGRERLGSGKDSHRETLNHQPGTEDESNRMLPDMYLERFENVGGMSVSLFADVRSHGNHRVGGFSSDLRPCFISPPWRPGKSSG